MTRKEYQEFIINNQLVDADYWQPNFEAVPTKKGLQIRINTTLYDYTIKRNKVYLNTNKSLQPIRCIVNYFRWLKIFGISKINA